MRRKITATLKHSLKLSVAYIVVYLAKIIWKSDFNHANILSNDTNIKIKPQIQMTADILKLTTTIETLKSIGILPNFSY